MGIFRRAKTSDTTEQSPAAEPVDETVGEVVGPDTDTDTDAAETRQAQTAPAFVDQPGVPGSAQGPFDSADLDLTDDGRLDLGALRILGVPGWSCGWRSTRPPVGWWPPRPSSGTRQCRSRPSRPLALGIWDEIRAEIAESILNQGGTADEAVGPLGKELRTRMPSAGPDGRTVFAPARFTGVDGPRWFMRAVFSGRAANDEEAAAPLLEVVRNAVVVRGDAAMAPREMLPLTLPEQVQAPASASEDDGTGDHDHARLEDLKPFERGPEITEIR